MWFLILFLYTALSIVLFYNTENSSPPLPVSPLPKNFTNLLFIFAEENCSISTNVIDSVTAVIFNATSYPPEYVLTSSENVSCTDILSIGQSAFSFSAPEKLNAL
jgi:hypothetical protein